MGLFDNMFKQQPAKPDGNNNQQQQQQPNQQQPNTPADKAAQPNGLLTGQVQQPAIPQTPENPLDNFKGMFDTSTTETDKPPVFSLPDDVLTKVATGQDFTQGIDPELMQKAMGGDAQAMISLINATSQNAYKQALSHTSNLSDKFVNARLEYEGKSLSGKVKSELTNAELSAKTPGFSHPVVKQQMTEVAKQLARQYPDASPQDIAAKAQEYVLTLANAINPSNTNNPDGSTKAPTAAGTDWDTYFG